MSTNPLTADAPTANTGLGFTSDTDSDGQARGARRNNALSQPAPTLSTSSNNPPAGQLLKGAVDENGNQKTAALLVGIKLDLEAEVHLSARIKGDIAIGLY